MMLAALPSFRERWERHEAAWAGKQAGDYNDVAEFAHHIVVLYSLGEAEQVRAGFDLIERLLVEGDDTVRQLAVVGVLEDVQNIASHRSFGYGVFEPWLGEQSRQAWQWLEGVWKGKTHLAEVVAAERGGRLKLKPWWKFWQRRSPRVNLEEIKNPALREAIEGLYRWERSPRSD